MSTIVQELAETLVLGALLERLKASHYEYEVLEHHRQGEFHHDVVLHVSKVPQALPGAFLVVSTNCNGGVKEVLCFDERPSVEALGHRRCTDVEEFVGELPVALDEARTVHWFDPCELLGPDARSELRGVPEAAARRRVGACHVAPLSLPERCLLALRVRFIR